MMSAASTAIKMERATVAQKRPKAICRNQQGIEETLWYLQLDPGKEADIRRIQSFSIGMERSGSEPPERREILAHIDGACM